ncbi:MAG: hybrid sensor histidine kinase/response regulator [Candidatus Methylomirabilia bacterium]
MLEGRVLGQLLLMQSVVIGLPNEETIFSFVCRGLLDIPGVAAVRYVESAQEQVDGATVCIPLIVGEAIRGALLFTVIDQQSFAPYRDYLRNFCFMLAVILEERSQRRRIEAMQSELEIRVHQRTRQLLEGIAERRSIEEALRASEAQLSNAVTIAHLGPWTYDVVNDLFTFNDFFYAMLRTTAEQVGGYTMSSAEYARRFVHPDDYGMVGEEIRKAIETDDPGYCVETNHRAIFADGATGYLEVRILVVKDATGRTVKTYGVQQDVTERKRAVKALAESEIRLRTLVQTIPDMVWLKDPDGIYLDSNAMLERFHGVGRKDIVGKTDYDFFDRELADFFREHDRKAMAAARPSVNEEWVSFADGRRALLETIKTPVFAAAGGLVGVLGIARDITERFRATEEKARLEDQLRQSQKVEAIGRLAGGVAHDFNNITAIVLGYAEMLLGALAPDDPSRKWAEQIMEAGRRSAALTRQLLAFSRKQTLQPVVLDLNALLLNLEQMLGRAIGEDIELRFELSADPCLVTADPGQIEQVVTNLVINARDAMPLGGGLTVATAEVELDETYALGRESVVPGKYVMLSLTDTGCGMDKATMDRLFEPFFTTKEKGKGTGLGLATAHGIVKQSGGQIWAFSEPGRGTTFKICLPRTEAPAGALVVDAGGEAPRGRGELILLVEDEAPLRELCETILTQLGYRVSVAADGLEALRRVREQGLKPDLVVTDVIMPGMSGAEIARELRRDRPDLKVLYMSGYSDDAIARHGVLEAGINFVEKPFTEPVLAAKVREALGE